MQGMQVGDIPQEVHRVADALAQAGFSAYLVGGCVRDLLMDRVPKDWDIATSAKPEKIQKLFIDSVYENQFGTVCIKTESEDPALKIIEVTTFRLEGKYTDKRHPDEIKFAETIEEDLGRRDFTVNAMALIVNHDNDNNDDKKMKSSVISHRHRARIIDPFHGEDDLRARVIRAVGNPDARFTEDALRLLRAIRFSSQLNFSIEEKTASAIARHANLLEFISKERIRDEFAKLIMTDRAADGVVMLERFGLLRFILPELEEGIGVGQNKHHIYTVFEHNLKSLAYAVAQHYSLEVRLASLFHDLGKPRSKRGEGPDCTFYGHQVVGERMVLKAMDRLRFPKDLTEHVALLVREHMFVYDPEVVTLAGVRRLVRRVGSENMDDLFRLREADRIGSGVPKAQPYRLRHLKAMVEKVQQDPISAKMLSLDGNDVMRIAGTPPGPKVGMLLAILLEEVLDKPELNDEAALKARIEGLNALAISELAALAARAKQKAAAAQERIDDEIKKKFGVQ